MIANGFEEFVSIIECGNLTAAAAALGLPRPTLSKRLARLEERLGVRLIHRTTRSLTLTKQGEVLYEKARGIVLASREAVAAIQRLDDVPRGLLRVLVPPRVPEATFTGWLADFMLAYPEVRLDVVGTEMHVDLVAEGFDVALRYGEIKDDTLVSRTLVVNSEIAVATPQYLEAHGVPESAEDLADHNCLVGYGGGSVPNHRWPLLAGGSTQVTGTFMTNHTGLCLEAAKLHLGIALVVGRVKKLVENGELVQVLPAIIGRVDRACLVYPNRRFLEPKVRAFVDFIASKV
ncbi:MAG: LysR family transcriptional regulator [Deltaproteobacteria bacterium]|nr:LysR family transcriptional regulator [Deltaproteobacteria bacterium]